MSSDNFGQKSALTNVSLDNSLLGQKSPWTKVPWTIVSTPLARFTYILWYIDVYISPVRCSQCIYIRVSLGVFAVGLGVHAPEASDPETCDLGAKGPNDPAT